LTASGSRPATSVATFYRFEPLEDTGAIRAAIETACRERSLRGTVLLAPEGVNATLAGARQAILDLVDRHFPGVDPGADVKWSTAALDNPVFDRLKVRERPEIVSFDLPLGPRTPVAEHVDAARWNRLLADPAVVVLDVRNDYESDVGTFRGATRADTDNFREFPDFVERELAAHPEQSVAMFCTGGIRCEKASAYLLERGFERVCQLDGGILKYLADTHPDDCAFEGECFVFDQRVSVDRLLNQGSYELCSVCARPLSAAKRESPCPACARRIGSEQRATATDN